MKTVLLVDDEEEITTLIAEHLKATYDFSCFTASNGQAAVAFLKEKGPLIDLVICDIAMPMYDGFYVQKFMQEHLKNKPFIFFTCNDITKIKLENPKHFAITKMDYENLKTIITYLQKHPTGKLI